MTVLLVDWLGRGGIAQTSEAWVSELERAGQPVLVATRPNRELAASSGVPVALGAGRLQAHRSVADAAVRAIEKYAPTAVVIQNYVVPAIEWRVYRAAQRADARVILVVHDHRLHSRLAGNHIGLNRCIGAASTVVAHTDFVARALAASSGRSDIVRLPLPVQLGMLARPQPEEPPTGAGLGLLAVHFGTLQRGYKGTSLIVELAAMRVDGWRFSLIGPGAPAVVPGAQVIPGFIDGGALVSAVSHSHATLLPYSFASQSGAIVLAQALGSVVITTSVGGLPEQVTDGVDGCLLPVGAPAAAWRGALEGLTDAPAREAITEVARQRVWGDHARFAEMVKQLVA